MQRWTIKDMPDQSGRVAIVTGANSGLGYETVLGLAKKNAQVILAVRTSAKGEQARDEVLSHVPGAQLDVMQLDLSSLDSVRAFAELYRSKYDRLDLLINNAGVMAPPYGKTVDGFEMQFGTNHLGHFALTGLLLDVLTKTPGSRVVSVSSSANFMGTINFDDLMSEQEYTRYGAYAQSKLANVLFANEMDRRSKAAGLDIIAVSAHPGYAATNLQHHARNSSGAFWDNLLYPITNRIMAQSAEMGTLPQLYAATDASIKGGEFIGPHFMHSRGYPKHLRAKADAYDETIARRLWEVSEELTGVTYAFDKQLAALSA